MIQHCDPHSISSSAQSPRVPTTHIRTKPTRVRTKNAHSASSGPTKGPHQTQYHPPELSPGDLVWSSASRQQPPPRAARAPIPSSKTSENSAHRKSSADAKSPPHPPPAPTLMSSSPPSTQQRPTLKATKSVGVLKASCPYATPAAPPDQIHTAPAPQNPLHNRSKSPLLRFTVRHFGDRTFICDS